MPSNGQQSGTHAPRELDRRRLLAGASAGAGLAVLGGAQVAGAASGRSAEGALQRLQGTGNLPTPREQTVVVEEAITNIWDSFNPYIANGENGSYGLAQTCREAHFYANFLTGDVKPWLATEYSYNADFTEFTLKLNPDAKWSDGKPYSADDVVFSFELLLGNGSLNGAADVQERVSGVEAADAHTAVFTLTKANPRFHYRFIAGISSEAARVVPKHIWESEDATAFTFNPPIYTGPYTLKESSSSKLHYLWERNPDYWNTANLDPKPTYVLYRQASAVDAAVQEFLAGNLDVAHQGAGFDYLNQQVVESQVETTTRFNFPDPCPRGV
ncbi:MAG: ABC transporter substrate-binding protein, partial [Thermomicrobiales bacterium]